MSKLLIASNNAHKIKELAHILGDIPYTLTSLTQEGIVHEVEETGSTYIIQNFHTQAGSALTNLGSML